MLTIRLLWIVGVTMMIFGLVYSWLPMFQQVLFSIGSLQHVY